MSESTSQQAVVKWFRVARHELKVDDPRVLFSIPNGGSRAKRTVGGRTFSTEAQRMKDEGLVAGVPDLFLALPRNGYHGMFVEMKEKGNRPSDEQRQMNLLFELQGYMCHVAYGSSDAIDAITKYVTELDPKKEIA